MTFHEALLILKDYGYTDEESEDVAFMILEGKGMQMIRKHIPTVSQERVRRIKYLLDK